MLAAEPQQRLHGLLAAYGVLSGKHRLIEVRSSLAFAPLTSSWPSQYGKRLDSGGGPCHSALAPGIIGYSTRLSCFPGHVSACTCKRPSVYIREFVTLGRRV